MTTDHHAEPPLSEPEIVPCLYVTGIGFEIGPHVVRIVGWVALPDLGGEFTQRRIVVRMAMGIAAGRKFVADLSRKLRAATPGHH